MSVTFDSIQQANSFAVFGAPHGKLDVLTQGHIFLLEYSSNNFQSFLVVSLQKGLVWASHFRGDSPLSPLFGQFHSVVITWYCVLFLFQSERIEKGQGT